MQESCYTDSTSADNNAGRDNKVHMSVDGLEPFQKHGAITTTANAHVTYYISNTSLSIFQSAEQNYELSGYEFSHK